MAAACAAYLYATWSVVKRFPHNIDEGAYVLAARRVLAGDIFMVDFFVHQIPLYEYTLAAILNVFGNSWLVARGASILALAATAVLLYILARRLWQPAAATFTGVVLLTAPLAAIGQWAMPNALSLLWEVAAVTVVFAYRSPWRLVAAGALFTVAAGTKPLAAATATACVLYLAFVERSLRDAIRLVVAGLAWTTAMWIPLDILSQGGLTEVVLYELERVTVIGWRLVMASPAYELVAQLLDAQTPAAWNLAAHAAMLRGGFWLEGRLASMAYLLVLSACGAYGMWRAGHRHMVAFCTIWVASIFLFDVCLWFPVFDHYLLQYLPPTALLAGGVPHALVGHGERRRWAGVAAGTAALAAFAIHTYPLLPPAAAYDLQAERIHRDINAYRQHVLKDPHATIHLLTFNPFYDTITDLPSACNLYDPLNQIGPMSFSGYMAPPMLARHNVPYAQIEACIGTDPHVFAVLSGQSAIVMRDALVPALERMPVTRKRRIEPIFPERLNKMVPPLGSVTYE